MKIRPTRRRRALRSITAGLAAAVLAVLCAAGLAELPWPAAPSPGQAALRELIDRADKALSEHGRRPFNSLFECWPGLAVLGITEADGADHADRLELTATLNERGVEMLSLRCCDPELFRDACAALIMGASPGVRWDDALAAAGTALTRVNRHPENSFSDTVIPERGDTLGLFFGYEINPYRDGVNWLTATLVPPRAGQDGGIARTPEPVFSEENVPLSNEEGSSDWVGYFPELDDADHFEVFTTPTPEPDSPVYPFV